MDTQPTDSVRFDRLILASASPRRRTLLEEMRIPFEVRPADVEEHEEPYSCPKETVLHNARIKAEFVANQFPGELVLGCDTIVALDGEVLHKPANLEEAHGMHAKLSGRTHEVYTGICLIAREVGIDEGHYITSEVTFHPLNREAVEDYFRLVNPLDKAGAYGIQAGRELIISKVDGSVHNVMGLPTEFLRDRLEALGLVLDQEAVR